MSNYHRATHTVCVPLLASEPPIPLSVRARLVIFYIFTIGWNFGVVMIT